MSVQDRTVKLALSLPKGHPLRREITALVKRAGGKARLKPINFKWYPNLRRSWDEELDIVGPYHAGNPSSETVVRNSRGETMAVQNRHLDFL